MTATPCLLDTNILLSAVIAPERLPDDVSDRLRDVANVVYFSAASIWEISIKQSLNRAGFDFSPEDIHQLALETGFGELPIRSEHCYAVAHLPWHHRDPFDRLLVAQAMALPAHLLTADTMLPRYSELISLVVLR